MNGAERLKNLRFSLCGKVPYRLRSALPSVKRNRCSSCRPGTIRRAVRQYKLENFEPGSPGIEACLRKRKKEGLNLRVDFTQPLHAVRGSAVGSGIR